MLKCLPTSRMKSMEFIRSSQSALLIRRAALFCASKSREPRELHPDTLQIRLKILAREQGALLGLAAWVADEAGAAAGDRDRPMAVALHPDEHHDAQEVADVQAVGRWVESRCRR